LDGEVDMSKYETGKVLMDLGVISGKDITSEAALTKMMVVLGNFSDDATIRKLLSSSIRGEMKN
jgi:L-asparaginase